MTALTAEAGSVAPPGTVSSVAQERNVPQAWVPSKATQVRPVSQRSRTNSATLSMSGRSRNAVLMTSTAVPYSSGVTVRISMLMLAG